MTNRFSIEELTQELVSALNGLHEQDGQTITKKEFSRHLGMSPDSAKRRLDRLMDAGVVIPIYVHRTNPWGQQTKYMGYKFVDDVNLDDIE